jgi:phosphorylase kinase alpha/beta subunit
MLGQKEIIFDRPMTPSEIQNAMFSCFSWMDTIYAVLQQEVVLYCGRLIATNPEIFKGILKIRVGWVVEAMKLYLESKGADLGMDQEIENLSPFQIRQLLMTVLTISQYSSDDTKLDILRRRQLEGCLCRVPNKFYNLVWDVLDRCQDGISVNGHHLPAVPTLSNMSRGELQFALLVEEMLHHIPNSERRQISVELLCIVATILKRNPELKFQQVLDLDILLEDAFSMYCKDHDITPSSDVSPLFSLNYSQSVGYLARASVNSVLQKAALTTGTNDEFCDHIEDTCKVS